MSFGELTDVNEHVTPTWMHFSHGYVSREGDSTVGTKEIKHAILLAELLHCGEIPTGGTIYSKIGPNRGVEILENV